VKLQEDTFSLFTVCPVKAWNLSLPSLCAYLKTSIYLLIELDFQENEKDDNRLGIPSSVVTTPIVTGQITALFIPLISQNDLLIGLWYYPQGYDATSDKGTRKSFPRASKATTTSNAQTGNILRNLGIGR
jgi:hypothetical protein